MRSAEKAVTARQGSALQRFGKHFGRQKYIFMLLIPGLIWFILFKYWPLWYLSLAFTDEGARATTSFIGMDNFVRLFKAPYFARAFWNTLIISFYNLLFGFPIPIILALSMNELRKTFTKRTVQFIVYIPHFFSWVVVGALFSMMLSPSQGVVNAAIEASGRESIYFMASADWFRGVLVTSSIWRDMGYNTVIYIAAIAGVDMELYDAAAVDGAGGWDRLWHITLPSIRNTIATVLLLTVSRILQIFEQVLVMYNDGVIPVADVLRTFNYREALLNNQIGYGTAIGLFTSVVSLILILGCNEFSKRVLQEEII